MIIVRSPYRVSFLGGGTDFPVWYNEHGGAVISTTINKYSYVSLRWLPPYFEHKYRVVYSRTELAANPDEIAHPIVREALKYVGINEGVEIHHDGDIPARSGMGTSSAFTVALLYALYTLKGEWVSKQRLAEESINIEQNLCNQCVGSQDQTASAFGGLNKIVFSKNGIKVEPLECEGLEKNLLLFFTGFQRNATDIEKEKLKNIDTKQSDFSELIKLTMEGEKVLANGQLNDFGRLLHEGWLIKRGMANNTSSDYIDFLYQKGLEAGALGGKLLGAGGGGFLLFFVEPDKQDEVRKSVNLLEVPIKFDTDGAKIIFNNGGSNG